jgi:AraC-like DNA-binding protein
MKDSAVLLGFGARSLYIGPAFGLSAHRNAVAVLCAGLAGQFGVARDPRDPRSRVVACRTALIPPSTLHRLEIADGPIAFLYLDPQSEDVAAVRAAMRHDYGSFLVGLRREAAALAVFRRIARREIEPGIARADLVTVLGLPAQARKDPRITAAVQRMHAAPDEPHALAELAANAALSPSRFLHLFKDTTGVPLRRYRIWSRMGAATRSIASGATLTEAAHAAGFASSAHFSAAFRAMFGMTPSRLTEARSSIKSTSSAAPHRAASS